MTLYGNAKARSNGDVVDENEERACGRGVIMIFSKIFKES